MKGLQQPERSSDTQIRSNMVKSTADVEVGTESCSDTQVSSSMVNAGQTIDERCRTGMAILPVKVRAKNRDKTVITYAYSSNTATF